MQKPSWTYCPACQHRETLNFRLLACPACGGQWLDAAYDYESLRSHWPGLLARRPFNMWRYWELLPLQDPANILTMGEGGTPLLPATNLGMMLGRPQIYIKDERQGPTGSFKDRQAALAISVMKEQGITEAVVASTGNVAISYSAYSALAGIKLWAFLTSSVPAEKMREVALYGTQVIKVTGTYDQTKQVAADFARRKNLHLDQGLRSLAAKESMKTLAFELGEQLSAALDGSHGTHSGRPRSPFSPGPGSGDGQPKFCAPDWYIQAVSGGLGPIGVWKGFKELFDLGLIDRLPKLACIQAAGCAPMANSFARGLEIAEPVVDPRTVITTLATGQPGMAYTYLRRIILQHGGTMEAVGDDESFRAMHVMAKMDGLSVEPASGVAFAGLFKMVGAGLIRPDDVVIVNCSGHTFPVEKHLLGDAWARSLDVGDGGASQHTEEGLLASLDRLDRRIQRIAIVEDDPDARRLLRRVLQARGDYQIFEAAGGREGIALIQERRPDLVLLDLMMPEVDGFDVIDAIRGKEGLADTRIIVITAKTLTGDERRRLSGQIETLLHKGSFLDDDLLQQILSTLR
jgi:threonine synthase